MGTVNMSYVQIQKYLNWLTQIGMLDAIVNKNKAVSYKTTSKGSRLLSTLENLQEMLSRKSEANPEFQLSGLAPSKTAVNNFKTGANSYREPSD
jgi:Winged helix-turn-helix